MKYLRMLAAAAVVAAAGTTFAGAGTASATVLCATTTQPCVEVYPVNEKYHGETTAGAVLETSSGEQMSKCESSTIKGQVVEPGGAGEVAVLSIGGLTWVGCSAKVETVVTGELGVEYIAETDDGTVTDLRTKLAVVYLGGTCTYAISEKVASTLGRLTGALMIPTLDVNGSLPKVAGGFLCPTTMKWTAEYRLKEPLPLFVEAE